jgi:hypothetical protein
MGFDISSIGLRAIVADRRDVLFGTEGLRGSQIHISQGKVIARLTCFPGTAAMWYAASRNHVMLRGSSTFT